MLFNHLTFASSADITPSLPPVSLLILPTGIPLLTNNRRGWILENTIVCNIWGVLWHVSRILVRTPPQSYYHIFGSTI